MADNHIPDHSEYLMSGLKLDMNKLIIYTDGGARGNPGPAGIGAVIYATKPSKENIVAEISEYIGETTNNQAEYRAVIAAIKKAKELGALELDFYLDSQLVVEQLNRNFKVKHADLAPLFVKIYNEMLSFKKVVFRHIPREENRYADNLVNRAIDKQII